jgi:two-component system cell cycle sensor histidine kinase/response regulator CckA
MSVVQFPYPAVREYDDELAASEERYRQVVEGAWEVIFTLSLDGRLLAINAAFERVTGYKVADWIGKPYIELLHPDERAHSREVFRAVIERQESVRDTLTLVGRESAAYVELTSFPKVEHGRTTAIYGFARDVTEERRIESERRQLEARLAQADRLNSLGRLAATVAHEFNNILMGIGSFGEMIRRGKNVPMAIEQIAQSVKRGKRITSDILRFTQHAEPVRMPFDVAAWLDGIGLEARTLLPPDCDVSVTIEGEMSIDGDASQLQQVFTNLILNARDAMPHAGTLSIRASRGAAPASGADRRPERPPLHPEGFAHFTVSDSGCGMTPDVRKHIFEPLFTTKKNGTGLGLAVAHQVVTRHGGDISVESTMGCGTTFHILLPLTTEKVEVTSETREQAATDSDPLRLLLVEDDEAVAEGLRTLLSLEQVQVTLAANGADAIRAVYNGAFDVVVLDVGLPDIDGMRVYDAIAALRANLPVIFSTGHASRADALITRADVAVLLKPYDTPVLLRTVREVMKRKRTAC